MSSNPSRWQSSAPIRYPDPDIIVLDPRFQHLVVPMAAIERIATGFRFTEGPAYYGDGRYLLFSDIPNDALLRWDEITGAVATLRNPAGHPDGNTRDRQGRLITCELGSRTLTRTEHDGTVTVLASSFQNTRLTGPNDVVVKSDGSIWFSDNGAGIRGNYMGDKAPKEMPYRVYRLDPQSGALTIAVDDMERPNGLAFSPDEKKLYVVDTPDGPRSTRVYDVQGDKAVNGRLFFDGKGFRRRHPRRYRGQCVGRLLRRRGRGRRRGVRARSHADRPHPAARALRQPLLRRPQAQPAVHDRQPVGLCALCRGDRGGGRLNVLMAGSAPTPRRVLASITRS